MALYADLDQLTKSSGTVVKSGRSPVPCTVASFIDNIQDQVGRVRDQVTARTNEIHLLDEKWGQFGGQRAQLTQKIQDIKNEAEQLEVKESSLGGLEMLSPNIERLLKQAKQLEDEKTSLHAIGKHLTQLSPASLGSVQNTLTSVDAEWDNLLRMLLNMQVQSSEIIMLWKECAAARASLFETIGDARHVSEELADRALNDLNQAVEVSDRCRKSVEQLRKCRVPLDNLVTKSGRLHDKLDRIPGYDTTPQRQAMAELQRDWSAAQSALNDHIQTLDMQQVVMRQLASMKDEVLNWTSDSKETLVEALSQSVDLDLMQIKLNKVKQELPVYQNIQESVGTKAAQLMELNHGKLPASIDAVRELIDKEIKETQSLCSQLETSIASISQQEDNLRRDFRTLAGQVDEKKAQLKHCEDVMGKDDELAQKYLSCQQMSATDYPLMKETLNELRKRCDKLQAHSGSAGEASPLGKEFRTVRKQTEALGTKLKKLTDNLHDTIHKRYTERMGVIQRATANCRDKLEWCSAEPSTDRFGIEAKLDALHAVEMALSEAENKLDDLKSAAAAVAAISAAEAGKDIDVLVQAVSENLSALREECDDKRQSIDYSHDLLRRFESTSEHVSSWLRDVESVLRNETVSQTGLSHLSDKIKSVTALHADIEKHQVDVSQVKDLSEQVMTMIPESHVAHFSNHLAMRYATALKFVQSFLAKQKTLQQGFHDYQNALQKMEDWLKSSDDQLRVHEKDVTTVPGSKPSLAYQSKLQALKDFMEQKDEGQLLLNQAVLAGDALVPNVTPEDKTTIRTTLRNLRDRWETHLDEVNNLYKKVEGIILQLSSFDDSCRQIKRWIEETRLQLAEPAHVKGTGRTMQDVKEDLQTFRMLAQDVQSHQSLISRLRERLQEISNPDAAATVDSINACYQQLVAESQERVAVLEKQAADYDDYACSIETFRDWLSGLTADLTLTDEGVTDKTSAETKLKVISELLNRCTEGQQLLNRCQTCMEQVMQSNGQHISQQDFETQRANWQAFLTECRERNDRLAALCSRWSAFEEKIQSLTSWLRQSEAKVQDQALKATLAAKEAHLEKLILAQAEITEKEPEFTSVLQLSQQIKGDQSSLQMQVPQMVARYQVLVASVRDMIARYQDYVNEHQDFNAKHADFLNTIDELTKRLDSCREIVGDYKILLERRAELEKIQDRRLELDKDSDALTDLGEKLYIHTGPDGREMLRVQLKAVRERWEAVSDDLNATSNKLDECLQQCAEFSASQEQLTRWLKDVEQSMLQHSDLKSVAILWFTYGFLFGFSTKLFVLLVFKVHVAGETSPTAVAQDCPPRNSGPSAVGGICLQPSPATD